MTPSDLFEFRNNNFQIRFKLYKSSEIIESKLFSGGKCIQSLNILFLPGSRLHCNLRVYHQVHFWLENDYKTFWKIIVRFALQMKNHCYSHTLEIIVNRPYSTEFIFSIIVYSRILFLCTNFPKPTKIAFSTGSDFSDLTVPLKLKSFLRSRSSWIGMRKSKF